MGKTKCCCGCNHECGAYDFPPVGSSYPITLVITGNHPVTLSGNLVFDLEPTSPECIATACVEFGSGSGTVWDKTWQHRWGCSEVATVEPQQICCGVGLGAHLEPAGLYEVKAARGLAATVRTAIKYTRLCLKFIPAKKGDPTSVTSEGYICADPLYCGGVRVEACLYMKIQVIPVVDQVSEYSVVGTKYNNLCGIITDEDDETPVNYWVDCEAAIPTQTTPAVALSTVPPAYPASPTLADWSGVAEYVIGRTAYLHAILGVPTGITLGPEDPGMSSSGLLDENCNSKDIDCEGTAATAALISNFVACDLDSTIVETSETFTLCPGQPGTATCYRRNFGEYGCGELNCTIIDGIFSLVTSDACTTALFSGWTRTCSGQTLVNIANGQTIINPFADSWDITITVP